VLANPAVAVPIIGARNLDQLQHSLRALSFPMTGELRAAISALTPTPPPALDGRLVQGYSVKTSLALAAVAATRGAKS
jgi:hypothetical protein